jgi:hypothetical protein
MAHRVFQDLNGRIWQAWSVTPPPAEPDGHRADDQPDSPEEQTRRRRTIRVELGPQWANGWLTFETPGEKRRLAPYPPGWSEFSDEVLAELCLMACAVPSSSPPPRRTASERR